MSAEATARYRAKNKALLASRRKGYRHKEKIATARRRATPEGWAGYALIRLRSKAKKLGIEFNLEAEDITPPELCPVLGVKLILAFVPHAPWSYAASVDRTDNSKGYVKGNVAVISCRANLLKKNATLAEMEAICRYMRGSL